MRKIKCITSKLLEDNDGNKNVNNPTRDKAHKKKNQPEITGNRKHQNKMEKISPNLSVTIINEKNLLRDIDSQPKCLPAICNRYT